MVEGFGFQTKTLDLHIGPETTGVKELGVWGADCAMFSGTESRAWAWEAHVARVKDKTTPSIDPLPS